MSFMLPPPFHMYGNLLPDNTDHYVRGMAMLRQDDADHTTYHGYYRTCSTLIPNRTAVRVSYLHIKMISI